MVSQKEGQREILERSISSHHPCSLYFSSWMLISTADHLLCAKQALSRNPIVRLGIRRVGKQDIESATWVLILSLLLTSSEVLGNFCNLSKPECLLNSPLSLFLLG